MHVFTSAWITAPKSLPPGHTVCAIGDVHGCLAELRAMVDYLQGRIFAPPHQSTLVLIGDYIDRGPASLATLSYIRDLCLPGVETVRLLGNHDFFLALIVGDEEIDMQFVEFWLDVGGESTFKELGLTREDVYRRSLGEIRAHIRNQLSDGASAFLSSLATSHRVADYFFVHAGIDPELAFEKHDVSDLVMMREPFLSGIGWSHGFTVVHGHTIRAHEALPHRISLDTGAFRTGVLSCVQLEGDRMRWIAVTQADDLSAIASLRNTMARSMTYEGPFSIARHGHHSSSHEVD